jgi:transposase InsO family protein
MREIAQTLVRYGQKRIYTLLQREGCPDNHKRVKRLYQLEGLNLRSKRPRATKKCIRARFSYLAGPTNAKRPPFCHLLVSSLNLFSINVLLSFVCFLTKRGK